tara:strand:- start:69 stop:287 length:219 start_codon:yes stop_codon:yes gene_type:complete
MSLLIQTSNLTLAFLNSTNNLSQIEINLKDVSNNLIKVNNLVENLFTKLQISEDKFSEYESMLLDISNNIAN